MGSDWLYDIAAKFEAEFADYEFQPRTGKKGVQIKIDPNKDQGSTVAEDMPTSYNQIYFGEKMHYYSFVKDGLLLDISDVVTSDISAEEGSIADKLDDDMKYMLTYNDGKYYGLPHYEGFWGLTYDIDVFENANLFFNSQGKFVSSKTETRSNGPDGKTGIDSETGYDYSADDGLPATHEQFKELCNQMTQRNVMPFIWLGMYNEYFNLVLNTFANAWLGKEQSEIVYNFNLDGQNTSTEIITGFNGSTPITENVVITEENGYLLWQQSAHYYAADMANNIINSPTGMRWYHTGSTEPLFTHLDAQLEFIYGPLENNPIGMLIDGNYWENEAKSATERSINEFGDKAKNRRYEWMPVPGAFLTGDSGSTNVTMKDTLQSYAMINGNMTDSNLIALAKKFLKYCFTDESLREFTVQTGMTRAYDYTLSQNEISQMSHYAQSIWNYRQNADIVNVASTSRLFLNNEDEFVNTFYHSVVGGTAYERPYQAFYNGRVSSKDFFMGTWREESTWLASKRSYFEGVD